MPDTDTDKSHEQEIDTSKGPVPGRDRMAAKPDTDDGAIAEEVIQSHEPNTGPKK
jgi:hypothetical protein